MSRPVDKQQDQSQIEELERRIADVKARLPAHSTPPSMMIELDELEDQLAKLRSQEGKRE